MLPTPSHRDEEIAQFINDTLGNYSPTSDDIADLGAWATEIIAEAQRSAADLNLTEFEVPPNAHERIVAYYEESLQHERPDERGLWHDVQERA